MAKGVERVSHPEIEPHSSLPEVHREDVLPMLQRAAGLIVPSWCRKIIVFYKADEDKDGSAALMTSYPEYRWAQLVLTASFLEANYETRLEYVVHELCHTVTHPSKALEHKLLDVLDVRKENRQLYQWAFEAIREANEAATQDMAEAILRLLRGAPTDALRAAGNADRYRRALEWVQAEGEASANGERDRDTGLGNILAKVRRTLSAD